MFRREKRGVRRQGWINTIMNKHACVLTDIFIYFVRHPELAYLNHIVTKTEECGTLYDII